MDYHIHTKFSPDSNEKPENVIEKAIELGFKEIAITDHCEYTGKNIDSSWQLNNIDEYVNTLQKLKEDYSKKIDLKIGVELGLQENTKEYFNKKLKDKPFDFIIGSSHTISGEDFSFSKIHQYKTKQEVQELYFETVLNCIKNNDMFSVYGHFDFITRYGGEKFRGLNFKEFAPIIEEIFSILIHKGKGIEINTSGYRYGENRFYPLDDIVKLYRDMGGEIITIGSDSHKKEDIGKDFDKVYQALENLGIKYVTSFNNQIPEFKKIIK